MAETPKFRLLCSFGGKILPRPSDGALRYAGGQTRVLSLRRSVSFPDLLLKLSQIAGNSPFAAVKYQLPDEDLDNLISVSSQEDLDNMLDEFDRISEIQDPGSARIRIFLFSGSDLSDPNPNNIAAVDTGQSYLDAVNGIGIRRNNSLVSAASSNEGMNSPCVSSPKEAAAAHQDSGRLLGFYGDETLVTGSFLNNPSVNFPNFQNVNIQPIYVNDLKSNQKVEESSGNGKGFNQPLRELPPLHPALVQNLPSSYVPPLRPNQQQHVLMFQDCQMCQKALPHAHSDMLINDQFGGNGTGSGNSGVHEQRPVLQSYHTEHPMRLQASLRVENVGEARGESIEILDHLKVLHQPVTGEPVRMQAPLMAVDVESEPKVETVANGVYGLSHDEKLVDPSIETFDQVKVLHPNRVVSGGMGESMVEQKVDNMAALAQFGGYGFAQIPRLHDNERLQVNPNVSAVMGFPSDLHVSYGMFTQPSQWRPSDSFQPMSQNLVPPGYLVRQDMGMKQFVSDVSSVKNGNFRVAEPSSRVSVPEFSYDYSGPTEMKEGVHVSTFEPSGIIDQHRPAPTVNHSVPILKPETSTLIAENSHASSGITEHHRPAPTVNLGVPVLKPENSALIGENSLATSGITEHQRPSPTGNLGVPMLRPENAPLIPENNHAPLGSTDHHRPAPTVNLGVPMLKPENSTLTMENSHATSVITDHHRPVNLGVPMLMPESAPQIPENSHTIRPQVGGNAVFFGNGVSKSGIAPDANSSRQINQLPPSTADLKHEHASVALDNSQAFRVQVGQVGRNPVYLRNGYIASGYFPEGNSVRPINQLLPPPSVMMANHGQLFPYNQEMRVHSEIPNERFLVMPPYSCGINPVYSNNAVNMHNNVPASPRSNAPPIQYANSSGSNGNVEQFQGTTPPEPLFCNQDSQKILGNLQMMPSVPNKVPSKEFLAPVSTKESVKPKDLSPEKHVVNNKGSDVTVILKEGGLQHLENSTNKDACTETVRFVQGGENNKHEVQTLTEPVVTSVLLPSVPPATVSFTHERKETDHPSIKGSGPGESKVLSQAVVASIGDHKIEGTMTKQADRMNFGFPVTDDIGRLQIIKNRDLEELRELGSGTFGTVYHGKWRGSDVAIKRINDRCFAAKPAEEERMRADVWNEACMLADLHHPNVVAFYGVVLDGPGGSFATVTEFMVNGSLRRALQKNDRTFDKRKRLLIAMDVAFGMEYLHGKNLIHFDLKSDNLLVNLRDPQRPICKVADLGLSKVKCQTLISGGVRGTLPWMAPELLNGGSNLVSEKVDVFSFGIVMWELLTGEEPYADLHYGAIIGGIVSNTLRPPVPESCDPEWKSLMEQCWSAEASQRPNFTEIASRLRLMAASLPQKG